MTLADLLASLDLPAEARVDLRVPKTRLSEYSAATAADRRLITDGIERVQWVAAVRPANAGVAEYRDDMREYLEIAVVQVTLRPTARAHRLDELIHRAIPYPLLLLSEQEQRVGLSAAHKRWSQGEAGKVVLDGDVVSVTVDPTENNPHESAFRQALALGQQPRGSLLTVYQGWIDALIALQAARRTGRFGPAGSAEATQARRDALTTCVRLEIDMARLRSAAEKETQLPCQVALNLELKRLEAALAEARAQL